MHISNSYASILTEWNWLQNIYITKFLTRIYWFDLDQ